MHAESFIGRAVFFVKSNPRPFIYGAWFGLLSFLAYKNKDTLASWLKSAFDDDLDIELNENPVETTPLVQNQKPVGLTQRVAEPEIVDAELTGLATREEWLDIQQRLQALIKNARDQKNSEALIAKARPLGQLIAKSSELLKNEAKNVVFNYVLSALREFMPKEAFAQYVKTLWPVCRKQEKLARCLVSQQGREDKLVLHREIFEVADKKWVDLGTIIKARAVKDVRPFLENEKTRAIVVDSFFDRAKTMSAVIKVLSQETQIPKGSLCKIFEDYLKAGAKTGNLGMPVSENEYIQAKQNYQTSTGTGEQELKALLPTMINYYAERGSFQALVLKAKWDVKDKNMELPNVEKKNS